MKKEGLVKKLGSKINSRITKLFAFSTACVLLVAIGIGFAIEVVIIEVGWIGEEEIQTYWMMLIGILGAGSIVVSGILSYFISKNILKPISKLVDGLGDLAKGKYETRLDMGKGEEVKEVSDSFNSLAKELQNTEILRSDFINNFSHEFKTPIVSIKGFASLLKNKNISEEKRSEYISIIEEETDRLTTMTTNILNLTKLENQDILSHKNDFNLSEQIRTSVLMLEREWDKKRLQLCLDFEDCQICANEDLLKQVWINLIDNAIKFSQDGGKLNIFIEESPTSYSVSIENEGDEISEEEREKIFQKFYQVNKKNNRGNGIGLSIVKRIVHLHGGGVEVKCRDGMVIFTVQLPKK